MNDLKFTTAGDYMAVNQVSTKEKIELVEAIKGPHYYRISVNGYGGETVFANISEEAREYWAAVTEEHGDSDLVTYCVNSEDFTQEQLRNGECEDFDNIDPADLTDAVLFLHDEPNQVGAPWYEPPNEKFHDNQANLSGAYLYVEKIDGLEYNSAHLEDVIDGEDIEEFISRIGEASDWEIEASEGLSSLTDWEGNPRKWQTFDKGDCVFQFHSAEKGGFFDGYLETQTLFDETKLRVIVDEDAAGNDVIWGFTYDGVEINNDGGGDTNGKGYYAWVWKQEY